MFVSYAQNLEDVMLWRALADVEKGFYVDVGAYHPVEHSVTKSFYDRGWHGLNIEPVDELHRRFVDERPRDINLNVALGTWFGEFTFYEIPGTGLSTCRQDIAARHAGEGYDVRLRVVPFTTLDAVCREQHIEEVHFLKIDVEGGERAVLEGAALDDVRPWIVVVESTEPLSTRENHSDWDFVLLAKGYEFVYFDGLNRFYVAQEHAELKPHFAMPPNVFDDYVPCEQLRAQALEREVAMLQKQLSERLGGVQALEGEVARLQEHIADRTEVLQALEGEVARLQDRLAERTEVVQALEGEVARLRCDIQELLGSRSVRMTAPLRAVAACIREAMQRLTPAWPSIRGRATLKQLKPSSTCNPVVDTRSEADDLTRQLSEPARGIYTELQRVLSKSQDCM